MFSTEVAEKPKCLEMFWAQRKQIVYDPAALSGLLYAQIWTKIIFEELHRAGERPRGKISLLVAWIAREEKEPQSLMPGRKSLGEGMLQGECRQTEVKHAALIFSSDQTKATVLLGVGGSVAPTSAFYPPHRGAHGWAQWGPWTSRKLIPSAPKSILVLSSASWMQAPCFHGWESSVCPKYLFSPLSFISLFIIIGLCLCSSWPGPRGALYPLGTVSSHSQAVLFQDGQLGLCEWHTLQLTVSLQDSSLPDDVLIAWDFSIAQVGNWGFPFGMHLGLTSEMYHEVSRIWGRRLHKLLYLKALWMKEMCVDMVCNRKYTQDSLLSLDCFTSQTYAAFLAVFEK